MDGAILAALPAAAAEPPLARAARTMLVAMLQARRRGLRITGETQLQQVFKTARAELEFLFEAAEALGWEPVPGWITSTVPRRRVTVDELVGAFARGAPEAS